MTSRIVNRVKYIFVHQSSWTLETVSETQELWHTSCTGCLQTCQPHLTFQERDLVLKKLGSLHNFYGYMNNVIKTSGSDFFKYRGWGWVGWGILLSLWYRYASAILVVSWGTHRGTLICYKHFKVIQEYITVYTVGDYLSGLISLVASICSQVHPGKPVCE